MSAMRDHVTTKLRELQRRRCGICGWDRDLVLDHHHGSDMIRGYLCRGCNTSEGSHRRCPIPRDCPICTWRESPAIAWLGYTTAYGTFCRATSETGGQFMPMEELIELRRAVDAATFEQRCAIWREILGDDYRLHRVEEES